MRRLRFSAIGLLIALLSSLLVLLTGQAAHAADRDCGDFASQRSAQIFFLKHGGPRRDPHRLDSEGDGIACESNPAPYYFGSNPSAPKPTTTVRSALGLEALPAAAIAGERARLRVQAAPRIKRTVFLQRRTSGGWKRIDSGRTSKRGRLTFAVSVRARSTAYRAVAPKMRTTRARYSAATSPTRRVVTQRQSVALFLPNGAITATRFTAVADAVPARRGRPVVLQRLTGRGWKAVGRDRESRRGRAVFDLSAPKTARSFTYRAVVRAADGARAVRSERERLLVTKPTPSDTTPPPVPTGLTAAAGNAEVALTWTAVSAADLAGYVVYVQAGDGSWTEVTRSVAESFVVRQLTNGQQYSFAVAAVDTTGNVSARSPSAQATPVPPDTTAPNVPTGLTASAGDTQVTLDWQAVTNPDVAGYNVYRRVAPNGDWSRITATLLDTSTYTDTGLTNGTQYDFAVTAVDDDSNESDRSATSSATPADVRPDAPTALTATAGDNQVRLEWTPATDDDVVGYQVYLRTAPATDWEPAPNGKVAGTTHVVTGLTNGTEYQFSVTALEDDGTESQNSDSVSATPVAPAPQ